MVATYPTSLALVAVFSERSSMNARALHDGQTKRVIRSSSRGVGAEIFVYDTDEGQNIWEQLT
jgi:hypothetical protein